MTHSRLERVVPKTAQALLESHPHVCVLRDVIGMITVSPLLSGGSPYVRFDTLIHMSHLPDGKPGSALRIAGMTRPSADHLTEILVPTLGSLDDKEVARASNLIAPDSVIDMAREGVELLNDLCNLPAAERNLFMSIPTEGSMPSGNGKAFDEMRFEEPAITAETFGSIAPERLVFAAFGVAKRILLGES